MHRRITAVARAVGLVLTLAWRAVPVQPADVAPSSLPAPPECRRALDALQAREAELIGRRSGERGGEAPGARAPDPQLAALRRRAALACLGPAAASAPLPQHLAQPPIAVPPVGLPATGAGPLSPIGAVPRPLPAPRHRRPRCPRSRRRCR